MGREAAVCTSFCSGNISASDHPHERHRPPAPWYLPGGFANRNRVRGLYPCSQARVSRALGPSPSGENCCIFAGPVPGRSRAAPRATNAQGRVFVLHVRDTAQRAQLLVTDARDAGAGQPVPGPREQGGALQSHLRHPAPCLSPVCPGAPIPRVPCLSGILLGTCSIRDSCLSGSFTDPEKALPLGRDRLTALHAVSLCPLGALWSRTPDFCMFSPQAGTPG